LFKSALANQVAYGKVGFLFQGAHAGEEDGYMRLSGFLPVAGRRVVVALGAAAMVMVAASAQAQTPAADQPDPLKFDGTHPAMILLSIKAPAEAGFNESMGKLKAALAASSNPKAKEFGDSIQVFKLNVPASVQQAEAGPVFVYILYMEKPVAGQSYNPLQFFYYSGFLVPVDEKGQPGGTPEERKKVDDIYKPIVDAVASLVPWPLVKK
jgi:hypothetical protein